MALLQFKISFSVTSEFSPCAPGNPKTESWKEGRDCCSWDGVTCDKMTGHVIGLDLTCSMLYGSIHSNSTLFSLSHLQQLTLVGNNFNGSHIPSSFAQLLQLTDLFLSFSNFSGPVPSELFHLSKLVSLDLEMNDVTLEPISFNKLAQNLSKLRELDLADINLSLLSPDSLTNLSSSLSFLWLENCNLQGRLPDSLFTRPNLRWLSLRGNKDLTVSFPSNSSVSSSLVFLDLSETRISIFLENDTIHNLKSVEELDLSNCNIATSSNLQLVGSLTQLTVLDLSSNNFGGQIPISLGKLVKLEYLNLASNNFSGRIPISEFRNNSLVYIDLSNNSLHGRIPSSIFKQVKLSVLILSSNNKLTGVIPPSICKLKQLTILDLAKNSFSGSIPQCLGNSSNQLQVMHLGRNNLQGTIPSTFSKGSSLRYLNLNGNKLGGEIPPSIVNCTELEVFNMGNNEIKGTFPNFLRTLPKLQLLSLKSNKLHGCLNSVSADLSFPNLRILELSNNNFSGPLPEAFFSSLKAMMNVVHELKYMGNENSRYDYSVSLTLKGVEIELVKILTMLTVLDLSGNKFTRTIPESIGKLQALKGLNISHNALTGYIQPSLARLINLESLDLSSNLLLGGIPMQLVNLISLAVLNLSYNQLEGPIPNGKQFNTFDNTSYEGNLGLCGFPMSNGCNNGERQQLPPSSFQEASDSIFEEGFGWKAVVIGYGCGLLFGLMVGYVVFRTRRPAWFVRMLEGERRRKTRRVRRNGRRNGTRGN